MSNECIYTMYIYCANENYLRVFGVSYGYPMDILWLSYGAGCSMKVEYKDYVLVINDICK